MKTMLMPVTVFRRLTRRNIIDTSFILRKRTKPPLTLNEILEDVADRMNVSSRAMISKCRERELVDARCIYAFRARKLTSKSLKEIGSALNRDHATILHYLHVMQDVREVQILYNKLYHNEL